MRIANITSRCVKVISLCSSARTSISRRRREPFRQFCLLASAIVHFEHQKQLEDLKDDYAPFDPDSETRPLHQPAAADLPDLAERLFAHFDALLERANFQRFNEATINRNVTDDALTGLRTDVEPGIFERLHVFMRGEGTATHHCRRWSRLWLRETVAVPIFHRLVIICKLHKHRRVPPEANTDKVYLKIYKDIPKHDLEMLLPARVRLSRLDQGLIVYPLVAGLGLLLYDMCNDVWEIGLGAVATFVTFKLATWGMAAAFGGYGYKSFYSYQVKKQNYNLRLSRNLYFQTLDSNEGVLTNLLDEAEEQECREIFLAYFCLHFFALSRGGQASNWTIM